MKVLLIPAPPSEERATLSGVHRYLYELFHAMPEQVEYVTRDRKQTGHVALVAPSAQQHQKSAEGTGSRKRPWMPLSLSLLLGYCREILAEARELRAYKGDIDLVHIVAGGCEIHTIAACLAGLRPILNTLQAMHGDDEAAQHWVRRLVERMSFWCTDFNIAVSDATFDDWHVRVGLKQRACTTIHNAMAPPVLPDNHRIESRRRFAGDHKGEFLVGICARLHHMKGHLVLLDAFKTLLQQLEQTGNTSRGRDVRLLIAGDGDERATIEDRIRELALQDDVELLGHTTDPLGFISALDLHVLPSTSIETIGYANIEAMFLGVPCIVSDTGGMKEIVGVSGGGAVVPAGNARRLSDAMWHFVTNPEAHRTAGNAGREFAQRNLTAETMAERTREVYAAMLCQESRHT